MKLAMSRIRKFTILGCVVILVLISMRNLFIAATVGQNFIQNVVFGALFLGLAFAVYRQYRWALGLIAGILLLAVVLMPVGVFNPYRVGDYMVAGKQIPSVAQTLLWLIPLETLLIAAVFVIDPREKKVEDEKS